MNKHTSIYAVLGAALLITTLTGCPSNGGDDTGTSVASTVEPTGTDPSGTSGTPTTTNPTDGSTTVENPTTTVEPETTGTTGGEGGFIFAKDPYEAYTQIDRHGAVEAGTAGIAAASGLGLKGEDISVRDAYNASNPTEDAAMKWLGEIAASVMFFHGALDDDLMTLKLVPATFEETVAQAGPVILPDTIKYDPSKPTAYPNGRKLEDPVVDITLAAVLLKLGPDQPLDLLANLPLNPPANDVPFLAEFPYLAPPHAP